MKGRRYQITTRKPSRSINSYRRQRRYIHKNSDLAGSTWRSMSRSSLRSIPPGTSSRRSRTSTLDVSHSHLVICIPRVLGCSLESRPHEMRYKFASLFSCMFPREHSFCLWLFRLGVEGRHRAHDHLYHLQ